MTRSRSNFRGFFIAMFLLAAAAALVTLNAVGSGFVTAAASRGKAATDWLEGQNVQVSNELTISRHAAKHGTQAQELYIMMLTGKCAASMTYCGGSEIERLHVCRDPVTGLVGAVLQFGDEITTGFYEGNEGYWMRRVGREKWGGCE